MTTDQSVHDAARRGDDDPRPTVRMLGTHGVPAGYGGFETAVEKVGLHLVSLGWRVVVYCQVDGRGPITHDEWRGIERVNVPVDSRGVLDFLRAADQIALGRELAEAALTAAGL